MNTTNAHAALDGAVANPNIILFIADDMGWGDSRVYNPDAQFAMPHLEQLASEGMRFDDAHTSGAKCAPTRYSIMSGNYQYRGLQPWGQWNFRGGKQFLPGQRTLGEIVKDAGYATAYIGKMHLGGEFYEKNTDTFVSYAVPETDIDLGRGMFDGPLTYGFDYDYVLLRGIQRSPYAFFENDQLIGNPSDLSVLSVGTGLGASGLGEIIADGIGMPYWDSSAVGPILAQKALDYIDQHHQQNIMNGTDTPFFMFYSPQAAHGPDTPPITFLGEPVRGVTGISTHTDMIYENDVALGKLIEALQARGLVENTLIIFTSDNGGITRGVDKEAGHYSVAHLAGRKGEILEGGHRVPFIAKWGDGTSAGSLIPPGSISNQMVGTHDLMATIAAMLDQTLADDQARDSFNILPVLLGQQSEAVPIRDHLMMEADSVNGVGAQPRHWAYREGPWKIIFDADGTPDRLFNLDDDISETTNLLNDPNQAARLQDMTASFVAKRQAERTAPANVTLVIDAKIEGDDAIAPPGLSLSSADSVTITFDVMNNGTAPLSNIQVFSRLGLPVEDPWTPVCSFTTLTAGVTETCIETHTVQTGLVRIDAEVQADGGALTDADSIHYTGVAATLPELSIAATSVSETAGTATVEVTLSGTSDQPVTVTLAANDGTATEGIDYSFAPTTVTIPASETGASVLVSIIDDAISEPNETFTLNLANPINASLDVATAEIVIIDNDTTVMTPSLSINTSTVNESDGDTIVNVVLSETTNQIVTVEVAAIDGDASAGSDYSFTPVTLTIPANEIQSSVSVSIIDDTISEPTESFSLTLSNPVNASLDTSDAAITIIDDDDSSSEPVLSINDITVSENAGSANVVVSLNQPAPVAVSATVVTITGGSATAGTDYYAIAPQTITIPAGSTTDTVSITIRDDQQIEAMEQIRLLLRSPQNAVLGTTIAFISIEDNDGLTSAPTISIDDQSVSESAGIAEVAIALSPPATTDVTVKAVTSSGGSAEPGADYYGIAPVTFILPAGQTSAVFSVVILDDTIDEPDETIRLRVQQVIGAQLGTSEASLTIVDDDSSSGDGCGAPAIDRSTRELHLWRDCGTDNWHLLATGGSETNPRVITSYIGSLTSNLPFTQVSDPNTTPGLEPPADVIDHSMSTAINFGLRMASGYGAIDPLNFTIDAAASTCLEITNGATPNRVLVGPDKTAITDTRFDINTLGTCN